MSLSRWHLLVFLFFQAVVSEQADAAAQRSSPNSDQASTQGSDPRPEGRTRQRRSTSSVRRQQVDYHTLLPIMSKTARGAVMPTLTHYQFAQIKDIEGGYEGNGLLRIMWFIRPCLCQPLSWTPQHTHTHTQMPLLLWPGRRVLLVSRMPWAQALANLPLQRYIMNKKEAFDLLSIPLISLAGHVSRWPHSL